MGCWHSSTLIRQVVQQMGSTSSTCLLYGFCDGELENLVESLGPFQMNSIHCPLDARLTFSETNELITRSRPHHLIVPAALSVPLKETTPNPMDTYWGHKILPLRISCNISPITPMNQYETTVLAVGKTSERISPMEYITCQMTPEVNITIL